MQFKCTATIKFIECSTRVGHSPTLRQAVSWIAQSDGFLDRTHDGQPGVKTLWRGLARLPDIASTWKVLRPEFP